MADIREVFPTTADDSTLAGVPLIARVEGDVAAAKNGAIGFAFKDSSGNVVLPQLTVAGKVPVETGASGTPKSAYAVVAGSLTVVPVATVTLTTSKTYSAIKAQVSCRRDSLFTVSWNDNGTPTELGWAIVGAGQYSLIMDLGNLAFTSGATGTQQLILNAYNFEKASDLRGTISTLET